jgi:flagellar biosynthesis chaperone FliJ
VQERETVISNLTESLSKAELQLTLSVEDFKKEVENLRESLTQSEEERDKYLALSEKQHTQHERAIEST